MAWRPKGFSTSSVSPVSGSVMARAPVSRPLQTGIKVIDALLPRVRGRDQVDLLAVLAKARTDHFDGALQALVADEKQPQSVRLKALGVLAGRGTAASDEGFALLTKLIVDPANLSARLEAARVLAAVKLSGAQVKAVAALLPQLGPLELAEMLVLSRKLSDKAELKLFAEGFDLLNFFKTLFFDAHQTKHLHV